MTATAAEGTIAVVGISTDAGALEVGSEGTEAADVSTDRSGVIVATDGKPAGATGFPPASIVGANRDRSGWTTVGEGTIVEAGTVAGEGTAIATALLVSIAISESGRSAATGRDICGLRLARTSDVEDAGCGGITEVAAGSGFRGGTAIAAVVAFKPVLGSGTEAPEEFSEVITVGRAGRLLELTWLSRVTGC